MRNSAIALARAVVLATLVAAPAGVTFAADGSPSQQTLSPPVRQQAQAVAGAPAAIATTNGNDVNGDDPYVTARSHEKFSTGQPAPTRFSNEPNWSSPEYTGQ
jgi:hypothetical protein